jgi:Brp/Blh family beta-carotene 15,15'-monooxygenase
MERAERWFERSFLVATAVLVAAGVFGLRFSSSTTLVVLVVGVVALGLPHGALDPLVARMAFATSGRYSSVTFYAVYLFAVSIYALLWIRLPTLGLAGFLMISAYHFGSDWYPRGTVFTRLGYGLTVVALPAMLHSSAEARIFALLGTQHSQTLVEISRVLAPLAVAVGGAGAILQFKKSRKDLLEFLTIVVGALLLEPLVFFTCYFSLLHSPRHLLDTAKSLGLKNFQSIVLKSLPILIATLVLGGLFYLNLPEVSMSGRIVMTVFIGLAALTVPHMLLETITSERCGSSGIS